MLGPENYVAQRFPQTKGFIPPQQMPSAAFARDAIMKKTENKMERLDLRNSQA